MDPISTNPTLELFCSQSPILPQQHTSNTSSIGVNTTGQALYIKQSINRTDRILVSEPLTAGCYRSFADVEEPLRPEHIPVSVDFDLVQIYFEHIHPFLPIIHKNLFQVPSVTTELSNILLYAVYALAARWCELNQPGSMKVKSENYYQLACQLLDDHGDAPRLATVQALLLLIKYHERVSRTGFSWRTRYFFQLLARMSKDLGLTKELPQGIQANPRELEQRRRTFWAAFTYDIWMSLEIGSQPYYSPKQSTINYPTLLPDEVQQKAEKDMLLNFHWTTKIAKIQASVLEFLRQKYTSGHSTEEEELKKLQWEVSVLGTALSSALGNVPEQTSRLDSNDYMLCFVYMAYHCLVILLNRPYAFSKTLGHEECCEKQEVCLLSALTITQIVERAIQTGGIGCFDYMSRGVQQVVYFLSAAVTVYRSASAISQDSQGPEIQACERSLELIQSLLAASPASDVGLTLGRALVPQLQHFSWEDFQYTKPPAASLYKEEMNEELPSKTSLTVKEEPLVIGRSKSSQRNKIPRQRSKSKMHARSSSLHQLDGSVYVKQETLAPPSPTESFQSSRMSTDTLVNPRISRHSAHGQSPYAHHRRSAPLIDAAYQTYQQHQSLAMHHHYYNRQAGQTASNPSLSQPPSPTISYETGYQDSMDIFPDTVQEGCFESSELPQVSETVMQESALKNQKNQSSEKASNTYPRRHTISSGSYTHDKNVRPLRTRPSLHAMAMRNTIQQMPPVTEYYGNTIESSYDGNLEGNYEMLQDILLPTEPVLPEQPPESMLGLLMEQTIPSVWEFREP
ncbi:fungal-specific transcription factor domain-containing protein [Phycomyces nitens]|nr:fungal-specific transcription factor domain-containing protein [Phycomyces nitens]